MADPRAVLAAWWGLDANVRRVARTDIESEWKKPARADIGRLLRDIDDGVLVVLTRKDAKILATLGSSERHQYYRPSTLHRVFTALAAALERGRG